ncbi:unnamed protein product [Chondrus crispus]|uniref:Uncharacterized protein n=1 Tax=Chondrus crispus TaxID=2769 RepID=R7QSG9_CHOCR|nr:unnamed protein product [Chondrus crispus]CDF40688.1 unnamed protein product [Chondrus crispus]|eukprot:XP_005710982.1 unnamed protein product [Chondrus crispus]
MVSAKFIACLALFFSAALAGAAPRRIVNVVKNLVPITRQSETSEFAVTETTTGFGRITRVGVSVVRGANATLNFDVTVTAIDAETINSMSSSFVETLTAEERVQFEELVSNFDGSLNLPIFELLGLNFAESISTEQIAEAARSIENFETKSSAVEEILESVVDSRIRITGTLSATGQSNIPTVAFAFIELSTVTFDDGSDLVVVSSNPSDVVAADSEGAVQPSEVERINILF